MIKNKQDIFVCIIGFGKMGNIYSKYLEKFNIKWDYYDPLIEGGLKYLTHIDLNNYSHIIISTPPENHYKSYQKILINGFKGKIYIDKPVIIDTKHNSIFQNKQLFCGMTERYNPVVVALKKIIDYDKLTSIKFSRYSAVPENMKTPVLFDIGIHDLDLYLYLLDHNEVPNNFDKIEELSTVYIMAKQFGILSIFEWSHDSHRRERKIVVLQKDSVYEADLIDQTILHYGPNNVRQNLYVDKSQPLKEVMIAFLNDGVCSAKLSHELMLAVTAK